MNTSTGALITIGILGVLVLALRDNPKSKPLSYTSKNKNKVEPKKVIL